MGTSRAVRKPVRDTKWRGQVLYSAVIDLSLRTHRVSLRRFHPCRPPIVALIYAILRPSSSSKTPILLAQCVPHGHWNSPQTTESFLRHPILGCLSPRSLHIISLSVFYSSSARLRFYPFLCRVSSAPSPLHLSLLVLVSPVCGGTTDLHPPWSFSFESLFALCPSRDRKSVV